MPARSFCPALPTEVAEHGHAARLSGGLYSRREKGVKKRISKAGYDWPVACTRVSSLGVAARQGNCCPTRCWSWRLELALVQLAVHVSLAVNVLA